MTKFIDLAGKKIGRLSVIERTENTDKKTAWKCKCDCGNYVTVKGCNLYRKDNPTISCGCAHNEPKYDLTGRRFGKLLVMGLSSDNPRSTKDGKKRWKCQCDCGNIAYVMTGSLISGSTKGCGCLTGENFRRENHATDLTGKRFGNLTVLKREENITYKGGGIAVQWLCKCDCGNEVIVRAQELTSENKTSCGCVREEIGNKPFQFEVGEEVITKHGKFLIEDYLRKERESQKIKDKKYVCKCLECGEKNVVLEHTLVRGMGSCKACSDTRSFGERFFYWFLKQCKIDFETEYSPIWSGRKRYDFCFAINGENYIVEIDGVQHIKRYASIRLSYEEVVAIDKEKERIAEENNHKIIRINCEKSKGKFIAERIKESELKYIFDLEKVDWDKCFYMAMTSKTRKVCDLWNSGCKSTKDIADTMKSSANYISKLLVECSEFGLCDYDPTEEQEKARKKNLKNSKKIICTDNGMIFQGAEECSRKSEEVFGMHLNGGSITRVCRKERKAYKGFHFEYVED